MKSNRRTNFCIFHISMIQSINDVSKIFHTGKLFRRYKASMTQAKWRERPSKKWTLNLFVFCFTIIKSLFYVDHDVSIKLICLFKCHQRWFKLSWTEGRHHTGIFIVNVVYGRFRVGGLRALGTGTDGFSFQCRKSII